MTEIETISIVAVVVAVGVPVGVFHRAVARELRALHDRIFWNDVPKKEPVAVEPSAPTLRSETDAPALPPLVFEPDPVLAPDFPTPAPERPVEKKPRKREKPPAKKRARPRASAR